jgi:hypothetical protein
MTKEEANSFLQELQANYELSCRAPVAPGYSSPIGASAAMICSLEKKGSTSLISPTTGEEKFMTTFLVFLLMAIVIFAALAWWNVRKDPYA